MKTIAGLFILWWLFCSPARTQEREYPDAQVLSACIQAAVPEIAKRNSRPAGTLVYVAPKGEAALYFVSDGQVRSELKGADWAILSTPLNVLRSRTKEGWNPPKSMAVDGLNVVVSDPPQGQDVPEKPLYFKFWPPGYSEDLGTGIVRASFGPSPHGATVTCALAKRGESWVIVNIAVAFYV